MSELKIITHVDDDGGYEEVRYQEFFIDGVKIGSGYYGGEPEDNSYDRDYDWVDVVISRVARKLGATVTEQIVIED